MYVVLIGNKEFKVQKYVTLTMTVNIFGQIFCTTLLVKSPNVYEFK